MKKTVILLTVVMIFLNVLSALELLKTPKKYKKPTDGISLAPTNDTNTDSWIVFSDNDFRKYLAVLREALIRINHIYNNNNKYSFISNDTPYYWIDFNSIQ